MRVAFYQSHIEWENKDVNLGKVENCLKHCKENQVDILFLPEMSLTGFSMHTELTKEKDGNILKQIQVFAGQYDIMIGVGWVMDLARADGLCENHYSIVSKDGVLSDYAKIHPFSYSEENQYFVGGDSLAFCSVQDFTIGTAICYDLRFPELFQKISAKADLIVVPANWPKKRRKHWKCLLQARAIENQSYVLGVNCGGEIGGMTYSGDSVLYDPNGEKVECNILWRNSLCSEEVLYACEIENQVKKIRESFPVKKDRRETLYATL